MIENTMDTILNEDFFSSYRGLLSLSDLPMAIVSRTGTLVHEISPIPDFCKRICPMGKSGFCAELSQLLESSDQESARKCTCGLLCRIIPISAGKHTAAYVVGGLVYPEEEGYKKYMLDTHHLAVQSRLAQEDVAKTCSLLRAESQGKLEAHDQLCRYIARNISLRLSGEHQPAQSVEKDLLEREIIEKDTRSSQLSIDPRFLFNMLNCVARIAYFEHAEKTENLIYCLSDLIRFNSQSEIRSNTIQTELEYIEKYMYIQKMRFQSRLKYVIEVPEHIQSQHILNSVVQPLVDNALVHGILLRKDGGEIRIKADLRGSRIILYIIDNGRGFPEDKLRELRSSSFLGDEQHSICRINRRLKSHYGDSYGLDVIKSDISGSTVSVEIPKGISKR